jgi:hypothetical protein
MTRFVLPCFILVGEIYSPPYLQVETPLMQVPKSTCNQMLITVEMNPALTPTLCGAASHIYELS